MAEGGADYAEGHEEFFDFACSQCEAEDKVIEAVAYCPDCHSFFCRPCLEIHKRFLVTREHAVLDEGRKDEWGTARRGRQHGKECGDHDGQNVSMFCEDHEVLCCPVCVSLDHRTCENKAFIPHIAKGIAQSEGLSQTQAKLDQFLESLTQSIATRSQDEDAWRKSCAQVLDEIAIFRSKIYATLDQLEAKLKKEIEDFDDPFDGDITPAITRCAKMQETLNDCKASLHKAEKSSNESDIFIEMKKCQKKLSGFEEMIKNSPKPIRPRLVFAENDSLLQYIKATRMGEVEIETDLTNTAFDVSARDTINIKVQADANTCYIDGIVQMPNGQIIISDKANKRLKFLDSSYNVKRYYDVSDKSYGMCCISDTEIVVAMVTTSLLFISIGDTMRNTKSIQLNHKCHGIAHHDGKLFVTDLDTQLFIYDTNGTLLRTIQCDDAGSNLFTEVRHLAVNASGSRIYVTDKQRGLIVLERNGKHVGTLPSSRKMNGTRGICLDPSGNVFLACCMSHTVVQVNNSGLTVVKKFAEKKHGLHYPGVVVYDKARSCLLVANAPRVGCDTLTVYNMKMK